MLSSVLRSPRAIAVNIEIMRAFVQLRRMLDSNAELARKLAELERKYDRKFTVVFEAIRQLMARLRVRQADWVSQGAVDGDSTPRTLIHSRRCPSRPARALALMKSCRFSAPAGWARFIAPATPG